MITISKIVSDSYKNAGEYVHLYISPSQILMKWYNRYKNTHLAVGLIREMYHHWLGQWRISRR